MHLGAVQVSANEGWDAKQREAFLTEAAVLFDSRHPNIVGFAQLSVTCDCLADGFLRRRCTALQHSRACGGVSPA